MSRRLLPNPRYTPPTDAELELGHYLDCPGCENRASRRRGIGGVPSPTQRVQPHLFTSRILRRTIDLNSSEAHKLLDENAVFRTEVASYIDRIIAENTKPSPPLRGVVARLPATRGRATPERVEIPEDKPEPIPEPIRRNVDRHFNEVMGAMDAEVVDDRRPRRRG